LTAATSSSLKVYNGYDIDNDIDITHFLEDGHREGGKFKLTQFMGDRFKKHQLQIPCDGDSKTIDITNAAKQIMRATLQQVFTKFKESAQPANTEVEENIGDDDWTKDQDATEWTYTLPQDEAIEAICQGGAGSCSEYFISAIEKDLQEFTTQFQGYLTCGSLVTQEKIQHVLRFNKKFTTGNFKEYIQNIWTIVENDFDDYHHGETGQPTNVKNPVLSRTKPLQTYFNDHQINPNAFTFSFNQNAHEDYTTIYKVLEKDKVGVDDLGVSNDRQAQVYILVHQTEV